MSRLLGHPRAEGAFSLRMTMRPPWAVEVRDGAALTLMVVDSGAVRIVLGDQDHELRAGDLALVKGPEPYRVSGVAGGPTVAVIEPGQRCVAPDGAELLLPFARGLRQWGNDADGPDGMIVASYADIGSAGRLAVDGLPELAVVTADCIDGRLTRQLGHELAVDGLGQGVVLDRLIDVLVILAIRAWAAGHRVPGALAGVADPVVRAALDAMHAEPGREWTVAELAARASVSRASLAARFTAEVGAPPLRYLRRWRLALARDLLADRSWTLDRIAAEVGYSSGFALSAAFRREYGVSPAVHRRAALAGVVGAPA